MSPSAGSNKSAQTIEEDATKALSLLQQLTSHPQPSASTLNEKASAPTKGDMPMNEVHFCQGIAFLFHRKVGLGVSLERGSGFVIAKLPRIEHRNAGDRVTWSAPLFFHSTGAGLGATLGYHEVNSLVLLDTQRAVEAMTKSSFTMDANVGASVGRRGTSLEATTASLSDPRSSYDTYSYSVSKGAMVDVSWKGVTLNADNNVNHGLYGAGATEKSILDGAHEPPQSPALQQLYTRLSQIMATAPDALLMFGSGAPGQAGQVHEPDGTPSVQRTRAQQTAAPSISHAAPATTL